LDIRSNQKRNRLIALSFASVLLLLVYGPLAPWFLTADRFLYDTFASGLPNQPLDNAIIISIDPTRESNDTLLAEYGQVLSVLARSQARRIILPQPP
jgi:CHASE2 domain-containing sensor protein